MSQPLSPQAQAVLDAIQDVLDSTAEVTPSTGSVAAAALRAAADQVLPAASPFDRALCSPFAGQFRSELLAIAAELEGAS